MCYRYDFNISSAVTASLPQFTLQFSAYIIILYMLETLKVRVCSGSGEAWWLRIIV